MVTHNLTLKANEKVLMKINPKAADGTPAPLDANPVTSISDTSKLTFNHPFGVPYSAWLIGMAAGSTVVTIQAFSGGNDVSEQVNVTVQPVPVSSLGITFDPPQPK